MNLQQTETAEAGGAVEENRLPHTHGSSKTWMKKDWKRSSEEKDPTSKCRKIYGEEAGTELCERERLVLDQVERKDFGSPSVNLSAQPRLLKRGYLRGIGRSRRNAEYW